MKRVGPAAAEVRECAAEVVRVARGEQCLPGAKLVDTVSELTLVAIRTAATSYPRAAELSLQGTRGGARRVWGGRRMGAPVRWLAQSGGLEYITGGLEQRCARVPTRGPGEPKAHWMLQEELVRGRVRHLVSGRIFGEGGAPTAPAAAAPHHRCSGTGVCCDAGRNGSDGLQCRSSFSIVL